MHKAFNAGVTRQERERVAQFMARAWSHPDGFHQAWFEMPDWVSVASEDEAEAEEPQIDHEHVRLSDGREICPGMLYGVISDFLHARDMVDAIRWDGSGLAETYESRDETVFVYMAIVDVIALCLRQLRLATAALLAEEGEHARAAHLRDVPDTLTTVARDAAAPGHTYLAPESYGASSDDRFSVGPAPARDVIEPPHHFVCPPLETLMPLLPNEGLRTEVVLVVEGLGLTYEASGRGRPAGRLFRDDEMATYNFAWHRLSSIRAAEMALTVESQRLGEEFDPEGLTSRATTWTLITESSALVSLWHPQPEISASLALVGSALRSSYWLWLEDDDRAMAILRNVLEQVSRLRGWRLRPDKAALLEANPSTTPRDWLELARLGRLRALNRALGEFAHTRESSRWSGARELLALLQLDANPVNAMYTARGASLDLVARLAAVEIAKAAAFCSADIAAELTLLLDNHGLQVSTEAQWLEPTLRHTAQYADHPLGDPEFTRG